jgi:hypothetical protein
MEVAFEIETREARQDAMCDQQFSTPKEQRRKQRAEQNDAGEIEEESGRVFQGC